MDCIRNWKDRGPRGRTRWISVLCAIAVTPVLWAVTTFPKNDLVRLTRSETMLFKGENFCPAPKGQEFTVLKHDFGQSTVYVAFYKEDGTLIAVTLPTDALEPVESTGWTDLLKGVEAFREQRLEEAKKLVSRAAQDKEQQALANGILTRMNAVMATGQQVIGRPGANRQAFTNTVQAMRDLVEQLSSHGRPSLALPLDEGADRLCAQVFGAGSPELTSAAPSKVNREELRQKAAVSNRAVVRCRQAMALHRMIEATSCLEEGFKVEPERPELKAFQVKVAKDLADAEDDFKAADSMRKHQGGAVHALSALDHGLKKCSDYPKLVALRKEMASSLEERTAPPVTPAFLTAAGKGASAKVLEEGRRIYMARCTECHDLELLDSRSAGGWAKSVAGMARRAHLDDNQQAKIVDYITAAQNGLSAN